MAIGFRTSGMIGRMSPMRSPMGTPGYGDGIMQRQAEMEPMNANPNAMPIGVKEMTKKPGFFQQGGFGQYALAALSDFGARLNDRDQNMLGDMMAFQQKNQMLAEKARLDAIQSQQQRMQAREDKQWEWQNKPKDDPNPTEFERILAASGLPQDQQIQLMQDYARNRANPVQGVPYTDAQGNSGIQFIRPGQMQGQQGLIPIGGTLPPKGGSGGNVTGGFR